MRTPDRIGRRDSFASRLAVFLAAGAFAQGAGAERAPGAPPPKLCALIPSDASAFLYLAGPDSRRAPGGGNGVALAGMLVDHARAMGLLADVDQSTRLWIDGLAALPLVLERSAAIVLLGIEAGPLKGGGHRFESGRFALILDVGDDDADIRSRIQHLLNSHANQQDSSIRQTTTQGRSWYTLMDRRLPDWAHIEWGRLGDAFVVTLGRGAMERIHRAFDHPDRSVARDAWFRDALTAASPPELHDLWFADFTRITAVMDAHLRGKVEGVLRSLRLGDVERGLWVVGRDGRAVEAACYLRRDGSNRTEPIAGLRFANDVPRGVIPAEARNYAIIDGDPARFVRGVCDAYLSSRSPVARRGSRAFWRSLQEDAGVDIERDILARLAAPIIIHDHPQSAFRIPFLKTILIDIEGDAAPVRAAIDRFFNHVRTLWGDEVTFFKLTRDFDGVWYVAFGILGPAILVTDDYIIISFSPVAVRQNAALLRRDVAKRTPVGDSTDDD